MIRCLSILSVLLLIICPGCKKDSRFFSEEFKDNIKARVDNNVNTGIVIGVITPEGTSFHSYGVKSLETREPVDEHTVFEIGSITKVFTGLLLADEVVRGELTLDTPVQDLLPEGITAPTRNGQTINLVHLSNHSSSLPRTPASFTIEYPRNPYSTLTDQQVYDDLNSCELTRDIGSETEYSNYGTGLLGNVLALKNNTTYESLILERITRPLGMENTGIDLTPEMERNLANAHNIGAEVELYKMGSLAGAGALRSTAVDMLKFLAANMGIEESGLLPAMELSHKHSGSSFGDWKVGLGWITTNVEGVDIVWHDGGTRGSMSFAGFIKGGKKGVVVLTNSTGFPDDIGFHLLNPESKLSNPVPSIATKLLRVVEEEGLESAIERYTELKANYPDDYNFNESELNRLGYHFLYRDETDKALAIFKINVDAFPESYGVYDSYGEALMENNEIDKAIDSYRRSVELNPENYSGINMLKKLKNF